MNSVLIDFAFRHIEDEWVRLLREFSRLPTAMLSWQPAVQVHSIAWHVRHAIEWRYALVHILICKQPKEEELSCLGWEDEPVIRNISSNDGWHEPVSTKEELTAFLERVRAVTNADIRGLPPERYSEWVKFPWRSNQLLDEVFQDIRHSALHRGHIREIKKACVRAHSR